MRFLLATALTMACLFCSAFGQESDGPDPNLLTKAFQEADVVFTATVGRVSPIGMTNSIPASIFGEVTFKDVKALRGAVPGTAKFSFSYREGETQQMDLAAKGTVLVAVRQKGVSAVVPATDANLALVKKAASKE
jgi:hypothetical protein